MITNNDERSKMNTLANTVLNETESIIAESENIRDNIDNVYAFILDDDFENIRTNAEEMQTLVVQNASIEQIENQSINLYQEIKYILEHIENEYENVMGPELTSSFVNMRESINTIRETINTFSV
jgi:DNA repair ATPase RecN